MINHNHYDAIVIGAGHNGLVCANYLAKAGRRVLVLEASDKPGGMAAARTLKNHNDVFQCAIPHSLPQLQTQLVKELALENFGFKLAGDPLPTVALSLDGEHVTVYGDHLEGVSQKDQIAYQQYTQTLNEFARAIAPFWNKTPPRIGSGEWKDTLSLGHFGLNLRRLGKEGMAEFMRMIALPAQDLTDEYFESDLLKAALSWDFVLGNKLAPRSPNNGMLNQLFKLSGDMAGSQQYNSGAVSIPTGGMGKLVSALEQSAITHGVEIEYNSAVSNVIVHDQVVTGVKLNTGQEVFSNTVISNADPKTSFFKLLGSQHLEIQFAHRVQRNRNQGMVAKLHLGLSGKPKFTGLLNENARLLIAPTREYIESAFDAAKYGDFSHDLAMEILIPSLRDSSLAGAGQHVLSAHIQYLPYEVNGGWEQQKPVAMKAILDTLERYAPGIKDQILVSELLTPLDIENEHHVQGGHWHHTEFCIDQWWMNRPTYGASQYKTPVSGFFLCGAGAHPGGGIMGAAGRNCATEIIKQDKQHPRSIG